MCSNCNHNWNSGYIDEKPFKYIEIIAYKDRSVVKRIDVSVKSSRIVTMIENSINKNLNHDEFYTVETHSEKFLSKI